MKKKVNLAYYDGGGDYLRSMSEKGGNDFRQQHHLLIISTTTLQNLRSGGHFPSLVEYDGDLRSIAAQGGGGLP